MKAGNFVIVIAVVGVVAGVAWFRSAHEGAGTQAPVTPAKEGELCPEPPPAMTAATAPTSGPTTAATSQAAGKKLPRVVDLGADKCKACKDLAPILEQLRTEYEGRVIVEFIDVWKNPKAGAPYKVSAIPTQVFFDAEGKEVWRHVGFLPKADFIKKFAELGVQ